MKTQKLFLLKWHVELLMQMTKRKKKEQKVAKKLLKQLKNKYQITLKCLRPRQNCLGFFLCDVFMVGLLKISVINLIMYAYIVCVSLPFKKNRNRKDKDGWQPSVNNLFIK